MQEQERRDEQSVHIFIGLLLGGLVAVVAFVSILFADGVFGVDDETANGLVRASLVCAVLATIVYVYRHRRD